MPRSSKFLAFFNLSQAAGQRLFNSPAQSDDSQRCLQAQIRDAGEDTIEILMHDAIGDYWSGLDSGTIAQKIKENRGKRLVFDINSFGGSAYDGIAIYNVAAMHDAEVIARITGIGYSAASIIPMAADKIIIAENGSLGIHPAWMYAVGNRFAMLDNAKWLETLDGQIIDTYAARTGQPREQIVDWFTGGNHDGTVFSAKQALEFGFADELIPLKKREDEQQDSRQNKQNPAGNPASETVSNRLQQFQARHAANLRREKIAALREKLNSRGH